MNESPHAAPKKDLRRKRLLALVITLAVVALLVLLNTVDFSSSPTDEGTTTVFTPTTYHPDMFFEPNTDLDISSVSAYLKLDRTIGYTFDNQTVSLENGYSPDRPYSDFFVSYFEALKAGFAGSTDTESGFNALYSDVYFKKNPTFEAFTPQMVYDIEIEKISEQLINVAETEEDKAYLGATLAYFEVRYKLYRNDGSFRKDILGDEMIPLAFTLLYEKSGAVSVNSVTYIRYASGNTDEEEEGNLLPLILPIVWIVFAVIGGVLFAILRKKPILAASLAAFVTFLVSIKGSVLWQCLTFPVLTFLLILGTLLWQKKKAGASKTFEDE